MEKIPSFKLFVENPEYYVGYNKHARQVQQLKDRVHEELRPNRDPNPFILGDFKKEISHLHNIVDKDLKKELIYLHREVVSKIKEIQATHDHDRARHIAG